MSEAKSNLLLQQQKISRGLKGIIVALLALIGILKISIGGVINVPVALLFGDLFVIFFSLQVVFAIYLIFFPPAKSKKRMALVFLSIFGLLIVSSAFYAGTLRDYTRDNTTFGANLETMVTLARATFSFTPPSNAYFYNYGGVLGEGLLYALKALPVWLIIMILVLGNIGFATLLLWPLLVKIYAAIKEEIRDLKKRRRVLHEAGLLAKDEPKVEPDQVPVTDILSDNEVWGSNLLHRVGSVDDKMNESPLPPPPPLSVVNTESSSMHRAVPGEDFAAFDEHFELPTLDSNDEEFEALDPTMISTMAKVESTEDFQELERAVDEKGTFEAVSFGATNAETTISPPPVTEEEQVIPAPVASSFEPEPLPPLPAPEPKPKGEPQPRISSNFANFRLPKLDLLDDAVDNGEEAQNREFAADYEGKINAFFTDFNVDAHVFSWTIGSTFTRFEIQLGPTETVKSINPLLNDISRRLNGASLRFEEILPGKATSGLEVANKYRTNVNFKDCMHKIVANKRKKYLIPLGKDVAGNVILAPFTDFPHLLVAGATGSGKSVFIHTVLTSLIMMHSPLELRLMLIDPKRVELSAYANIPHLITPIIKEPSEAKIALDRLIGEMENRYKLFEKTGVGKLSDYNDVIEDIGGEKLPVIIAIVDEFADLFESEKEISNLVLRLVQKSRAAGIHLLIATQRPSVQVITGNIKANIPSRVAFMTASVTDSMTILGCGGAENLLGFGDMLVDSITTNYRGLLRVQAPYVQTREVLRVTNYLRNNYMTDFYPEFLDLKEKVNVYGGGGPVINDDLYQAVLEFTLGQDTISISRLQQNFNLGWPRARQIYDQLMQDGIIEPPDEANSAKGAVVIANKGRS
ncbi:MAG: DNA translocase SpoIIIE [Tenericutes bacterium ADurb.Bin087]|nr:MAG: DNA translocase SpoIIIE [Tenericutes bacterium ADurb.Bin087]